MRGLTLKRLLSLMLVAVVALAYPINTDASKSQSLKNKLGTIERKMRNVETQIKKKEREERSVTGQLVATEKALADAQSELARNKLALLDAQQELEETNKRLEITQKQLDRREDLLTRRVVDMYQGEDLTYANVMLGSSDMWSFLTHAYYLQQMLDSDTRLVNQIREDKKQIEADKAKQEAKLAEIEGLQVKLQAERDRIQGLADKKREQLDAIENSIELYERAYNELLAESRKVEETIRRIQRTAKGRARYNKEFKGGLMMPCTGRITSTFGYRVHPITGVYKLHTGVDIAVPTGTAIKAAADGTVIMAGWMGAYGRTVVVDHGGGVSTLYAHNSSISVKVGQDVKKGQTIAKAGSTGYSTGPHCHFEKRINGKPVNPM